tara:strand:+ start:517 stop:936 length:420 start_codon:yes stop_codon:yes gene_type:complete
MINKHNINKVLNKLPKDKVELEKVELALIDDMQSAISEIQKDAENLAKAEREQFDAVVNIRKAIKVAQKVDQTSVELAKKAGARGDKYAKLIGKARKAAEALGIKGDIKEVKQLFKELDNLDQRAEKIIDFNFNIESVR